MRRAIILILFLVFILVGCPGYLADPSVNVWLKAVSYHLFHANIFHLAANLLSVWFIFRVMPYRSDVQNAKDLAFGFIIATLAYFVAMRPVVGISNIIYAVIALVFIVVGSVQKVSLVWDMSDMFNGLMAFPNLIALIGLAKVVSKALDEFEQANLADNK